MSQLYRYPPGAGSAAVGTNGNLAPTSSDQVAGVDPGGLLTPLSVAADGSLNVNIISVLPDPLPVTDAAAEASLATIDTSTAASAASLATIDTSTAASAASLATIDTSTAAAAASLATIDTSTAALALRTAGALVPAAFDYIALTYVTVGNGIGQVETAVYKTGGAGGSTVATLTMAYDGSDRLSSTTKT